MFGSLLSLGPPGALGGKQSPRTAGRESRPHASPFSPPSGESSAFGLGLGLGIPGPRAWQQRRLLASVGNFTYRRPSLPTGLRGRPNPPRRGSCIAAGRSGTLLRRAGDGKTRGGVGSSVGGPAGGPGCLGRFQLCLPAVSGKSSVPGASICKVNSLALGLRATSRAGRAVPGLARGAPRGTLLRHCSRRAFFLSLRLN